MDASLGLLPFGEVVGLHAEHADDERQGQALEDERRDDDGEGEVDDQRPVGKRVARVRRQRYGKRCGERDGAAQPHPRDHRRSLPGRGGITPLGASPNQPRHVRERKDPDDPDRDHGQADHRTVPQQLARRAARERIEDVVQLQPDKAEEEGIDDEGEDLPHRRAVEPRLHAGQLGRAPTHVHAYRDDGEHARDAERGRRKVGEVAGEKGDRDLNRRVVELAPDGGDQVADHETEGNATRGRPDQPKTGVPDGEAAGDDGDHRHPVEHERRPVVDQALALDDRDDPSRDTEPTRDRGRGEWIGGRDNRAEHKSRAPAQIRDQRMRHDGDADGRRRDEADRECGDLDDVLPQVAKRCVEGRRVEKRRQDRNEHDVGRQRDRRDSRHKPERESAEHEQDRVGNPEVRGEHEQRRNRDQQRQQDQLLVRAERHGATIRIAEAPQSRS